MDDYDPDIIYRYIEELLGYTNHYKRYANTRNDEERFKICKLFDKKTIEECDLYENTRGEKFMKNFNKLTIRELSIFLKYIYNGEDNDLSMVKLEELEEIKTLLKYAILDKLDELIKLAKKKERKFGRLFGMKRGNSSTRRRSHRPSRLLRSRK